MQYVKLQVWTRRNRVAIRHRPPHRNSVPESRWVLGIAEVESQSSAEGYPPSEPPWGIEPQTYALRASPVVHGT